MDNLLRMHPNQTMPRNLPRLSIPMTIGCIICGTVFGGPSHAGKQHTGGKGAEMYCFMRQNGNEHEVSWQASYELIKRQSNSLFKSSPKHAAVMIIEAVVQHPEDYKECGPFLGDLFGPSKIKEVKEIAPSKGNKDDRYSY